VEKGDMILNLNDPDFMAMNKSNLEMLQKTKSYFAISLVPLDDDAGLYAIMVEVKDASNSGVISKGLYYTHRSTARKFRIGSAMKFIQEVLPEVKSVKIITPAGMKVG
jgi:hypothetical protein